MNLKIQIIIILGLFLSILFVFNMVRKNRIELKYALSWVIVAGCVLVLACFPKLITLVANFMGIGTPINMLFFFGFCFSLMIIFSLSIAISRLSNKVKRLTQEMALLEKQFKNYYAMNGERDEK